MGISLKELFESAKYLEVCKFSEVKENAFDNDISPYYVGALVFLGREEEAKERAKRQLAKGEQAYLILFFLLLSAVRRHEFKQMNEYVRKLFQEYKRSSRLEASFFFFQGMGVVGFYKGEFSRAENFARKALEVSLEKNDPYLSMLSNDLLGHSLCMQENYAQGLRHFEDSKRFSKKISNNANLAVIELAQMTYKIEAGWDLPKVEKQLERWIKTIRPQDYFTRTNAMLLKAKVCMLKGSLKDAESALHQVSRKVYEFQHSRQILDYNLLTSQLNLLLNEPDRALALIRTSLQLCQEGRDYYSMLRFKELESHIEGETTDESIEFLMRKTGRSFRKNFPLALIPEKEVRIKLKRISSQSGCDLMTLSQLEEENLLGLIYLSGAFGARNFVDERLPGRRLLISLEGELHLIKGLTSQQHQLLNLLLSRHKWTKRELVEEFWNTPYDAFIHDNKVYVTLKRLKERLGLEVFFYQRGMIFMKDFHHYQSDETLKDFVSLSRKFPENLNLRQRTFLERVKKKQVIKPSSYGQLFGISRNTSTRDLRSLCKEGFLHQFGKGPGTYYSVI